MKRLLEKLWNAFLTWTIDGMPWWRGLIAYSLFMILAVVVLTVRFIFKWARRAWYKAHILSLKYWHIAYPTAWWN